MSRWVRGIIMRTLAVVALVGLLLGAYHIFIRPEQVRWGATDSEVERAMPGDELVDEPSLDATRAITIWGTPAEIWPWLVQMGYERAGYYGYDLVENIGSSSGLRSADTIIPRLQDLRLGERVEISSVAYVTVADLAPNRYLLWASDDTPTTGSYLWSLEPIDREHTRLVSRVRVRYEMQFPLIILQGITEYADHVAIRRILHGIRTRVEGGRDSLWSQIAEMVPWIVSLAALVVATILVYRREVWLTAWITALASGSALLYSLYSDAPVQVDYLALLVILIMVAVAFRSNRGSARPLKPTPRQRGLRPAH